MMNPVWDGYFADPCVIRTEAGYFAYGTDGPGQPVLRRTGKALRILYSPDLVRWTSLGGALPQPSRDIELSFWAPEVAHNGDSYFMYYSAGGEEGESQQLRVAVSKEPSGPFTSSGNVLMPHEAFSIDASPFRDPATGEWYLFFAKDFLDGEHPGTGIAVVRLADDMLQVEGEVQTVLRASQPWQVYERDRFWYGRVWPAWYTVEGPFCVHRQGRYWLFYSGGLWKGEDYGIGVAVSDHVLGPYVDPHAAGGASLLRGLRGAGHNSVVTDGFGEDWISFHAWDETLTSRRLYVERLRWSADGPKIGRVWLHAAAG